MPVVLGEHNGRVYVAVPSWERVALHPQYDMEKLTRLQKAAAAKEPIVVATALGREIGSGDNAFRPRIVVYVGPLETAAADEEGGA